VILVECKEPNSTNVNNKAVLSMLISTMKTFPIKQETIDTNTFIIFYPKHHDMLFLGYLTTPSIAKIYRIEDRRMIILEGNGRGLSRHYPGIFLEGLKKTTKSLVMTEPRFEPNTSRI
jgi:hypothetical protein